MKELDDNIFEEAFATVMTLLSLKNHVIVEIIAHTPQEKPPIMEFRGHLFDLSKVRMCWNILCTQKNRIAYPEEVNRWKGPDDGRGEE